MCNEKLLFYLLNFPTYISKINIKILTFCLIYIDYI